MFKVLFDKEVHTCIHTNIHRSLEIESAFMSNKVSNMKGPNLIYSLEGTAPI